jgi:hypothetical protein
MGGEGATEEIGDAVARIADVIEHLGPQQNGTFLHANGEQLPW